MAVRFGQIRKRRVNAAFTIVEAVMSIAILALVMAGLIYGYVQTNYRAEWSSMSLAAQSQAVQAVEQARAAQWDVHVVSSDPLIPPQTYTRTSTMLIPSTGASITVTSIVDIINILTNPPLRQIRAACWWRLPPTTNGTLYSNTVVTWRAPDE
jgi:type II secretory pathway pseudopilin PulG